MAVYRIHRLRDSVRQQFRWAAHTAGLTPIRPKDYEGTTTIDAPTCYAAWIALKGTDGALEPGDVLEADNGELRIYKYVGFEQAEWVVPEAKPAAESSESALQS